MAKKLQAIKLSLSDLGSLKKIITKGSHSSRKLKRAMILLKLSEGLNPYQIAKEVLVCPATVYNIAERFNLSNLESVISDKSRPGRPSIISGKAKAAITSLACSKTPKGHSNWTLRLLADKAVELEIIDNISHEYVRKIIKKTT